ncbi:MAG TPA: AIR synthase-related protein [Chloroflexota bacterium]
MGSILDVLPHEGALFAGRTGALPLPDGRFLLVGAGSATIAEAATEPPNNTVPAPDDALPVRRPTYMDAYPLLGFPSPAAAGEGQGEGTLQAAFHAFWPKRNEPDEYVRQDPYTGGMIRVAQAVRVAPAAVALSYRLAVGQPSDPEVAYQLRKAVQGMADAATMLELPVLAGELRTEATLGLWPSLEVFAHAAEAAAPTPDPHAGDAVALVGRMTNDLGGSLYLGSSESFPPPIDLVVEGRVLEIVGQLGGATPLGRGGLLLTLARCCARARLGIRVTLPEAWRSLSLAAVLFGEAQSRFLVFLPPNRISELLELAEPLAVPVETLGELSGPDLALDGIINLDVRELHRWTS